MVTLAGNDERKQATILFADLCGSTARILHLDVEEVRDFLAPIVELMRGAVNMYGGQVYRVEGDAVLAVFGAPLGQEDQALRACLTAIELQRRASNASLSASAIEIRVGIHSGEVISWRDAGSGVARIDGGNVHLAKRLQEASAPGRITISAATFRLVSRELNVKALGRQILRDYGEVELFELSPSAVRTGTERLAGGFGGERLAGRGETLASLESAGLRVRDRRMAIIGLRGEAGIGKSRIALELVLRLRELGYCSAWVCARAYSSQTPYAVAAEVARVLLDLPERTSPGWDDAVYALRASWPAAHGHRLSALADLMGSVPPEPEWLQRTPLQRQRDVTEALAGLVEQRVRDAPLILVVDDIFHADHESLRLMEALERPLAESPLLLCLTYRQDFVHRWGNSSAFSEHRIGPLEESHMRDLLGRMLGEDPSLAEPVEELLQRADGNPFYLEQMAHSLIDDGTLSGSPGAYRRAGTAVELRVPGSIAAVIGARVDRLPGAGKTVLEAAAVASGHINGQVIGAMLGLEASQTAELLQHALSAGLLSDPSTQVGGEVSPTPSTGVRLEFSHGLVQETILGSLTRPRLRALHRAAYEALSCFLGPRSFECADELTHHAYCGEVWTAAAQFALPAISRSVARSANRDALRVFGIGLDAVRRISDASVAKSNELALRLEVLGAQLPLGLQDDLLANLERAEQITRDVGDVRRQAAVQVQLGVANWSRGRYRDGLMFAYRAAEAAQVAESRSLQMAAAQASMLLHHGLGHYGEVEERARGIERDFAPELAAGRVLPGWAVMASVNSKVFLADVLGRAGRMLEAQDCCDAAYADVDRQEHAFSRALIDFVQSEIWLAQDRAAEAQARLEQARVRCRAHDVLAMIPPILALWAGCLARQGRSAEALQVLDGALSSKLDQSGGRYNAYYFPKYRAHALMAAGRLEEALGAGRQAVETARAFELFGMQAEGLLLLAEIESASGRAEDARRHYTEAAEQARRCAAWGLISSCEQGLSRLQTGSRAAGSPAAERAAEPAEPECP